MKLWARIKKTFHYDWSVCDRCGNTIPRSDWTWLDRTDERWYCHTCALRLPLLHSLKALVTLSRQEKEQVAASDQDYTFWVIIVCSGLFWLILAAMNR